MIDVVQKLWGYCHTLRHDGIDYGDYIEQITYLLFLKMADERERDLSQVEFVETVEGQARSRVVDCSWPSLTALSGTSLTDHYVDALRALGRQRGILGDIYAGAQSRFSNPVNLKQVVGAIDECEWTAMGVDVKAAVFEGLLEKAASEGKKGAGQYFTPRLLIQSICRCIQPDPRQAPDFTIGDPACGTGGFLVSAYEWFYEQTGGAMDRDLARRIRSKTYYGQDLVSRPRRLALMNMFLHDLEPEITQGDSIYDPPSGTRFNVIITNPPFGVRGANQAPQRQDFVVETSNKQLNFLQHCWSVLKPGGRCAIVLPDNCLFADQAGTVFERLSHEAAFHTVVRLPRGTFTPYSPGTKTNVLFFTKGRPTTETWVYDARSNVPAITKKDRPLTAEHFSEFERCYGSDPDGRTGREVSDSTDDRWRRFSVEEVRERGFKIDSLKWLKDDSGDDEAELPEPDELAAEIVVELSAALRGIAQVVALLDLSPVRIETALAAGDR